MGLGDGHGREPASGGGTYAGSVGRMARRIAGAVFWTTVGGVSGTKPRGLDLRPDGSCVPGLVPDQSGDLVALSPSVFAQPGQRRSQRRETAGGNSSVASGQAHRVEAG